MKKENPNRKYSITAEDAAGLRINSSTTNSMVFGPEENKVQLKAGAAKIENAHEFQQLGAW